MLGGPGIVVQIDKRSLFHTNPRCVQQHGCPYIYYLHQNNRGHATTQELWAFGMANSSLTLAMGYMEMVQRGDAATLLPNGHTAPGSTIHSDMCA